MFGFDPAAFKIEDLEKISAQADAALRGFGRVEKELDELVGEGEAADGLLRATVDSGGKVKEITINPRAMRMDSQTLAERVTEAVTAAQEDVQRRSEGLVEEVLTGAGLPAKIDTDEVLEEVDVIGQMSRREFRDLHEELDEIRRDIP